jgi:colicin import membrane protein
VLLFNMKKLLLLLLLSLGLIGISYADDSQEAIESEIAAFEAKIEAELAAQEMMAEIEAEQAALEAFAQKLIDEKVVGDPSTTKYLKKLWVEDIAAEVKSVWNFPGAEDGWFVEVLVTQNKEGEVMNVKVGDNNVGNSVIAKRFIDSIERAVYKATPLPLAPDASVWQEDIMFTFYAD